MIRVNNIKKKNKLGSLKKLGEPKITNVGKLVASEQKQLCCKVPVDFHKEYKSYATNKGRQMIDRLMDSFDLYKRTN